MLQNVLEMAGQLRHFLNRNGRYDARLVVPKDLRPYRYGKTEVRAPLGADRRLAIRKHPGALAALQHKIAKAERKKAIASGEPAQPGRYPLTPPELAAVNYRERLPFHDELRLDPRYATLGIDDLLAGHLRDAIAGRLSDDDLRRLGGNSSAASPPGRIRRRRCVRCRRYGMRYPALGEADTGKEAKAIISPANCGVPA
jgi:hypothetical protein